MTPQQCRTTREARGWSELDLAVRALISRRTIKTFEAGASSSTLATRTAIAAAFQSASDEAPRAALRRSLTAENCERGRLVLGWSCEQLAVAAGVRVDTVRRFECGRGQPQPRTVKALSNALHDAGVVFGDGEGA
jgi:transcriptional regulator with XRE-family HTH domain